MHVVGAVAHSVVQAGGGALPQRGPAYVLPATSRQIVHIARFKFNRLHVF